MKFHSLLFVDFLSHSYHFSLLDDILTSEIGNRKMKNSVYDLLCSILLGVGNMCMFMGYDTQLTIVEPVLRSVHDRSPHSIDAHAGYYGVSVMTIVFTLMNLLAPWALEKLGSKLSLFLGSLLFTIHLISFFFVHWFPFYFTTATLGIGYALFYAGHGSYITEHSTRKTIERNSALTWALATSSLILGGLVLLFTVNSSSKQTISNITQSYQSYREYSDSEIKLMYGSFALVCVVSNIIFAVLPMSSLQNSISDSESKEKIGLKKQLRNIYETFFDRRIVKTAPVFISLGITTTFWINIYPTTLIFSKQLSSMIYLPAYYTIVVGVGEMLMGCIISLVSKRVKNFARMPTLITGTILFLCALLLSFFSTPIWATNTPSEVESLVIQPSLFLSLFIGILLGMADNSLNTSRTVLCALVIPDRISQVFSISKFYQSLSMSICAFLAPLVSINFWLILTIITSLISVPFYGSVSRSIVTRSPTATLRLSMRC
ncbi:hypothetical protein PFISCL1PPCAC_15134 [Pristionchus fissidentatus]|uniref:Membrane transporter n=1 Tax=Pristionchus fissidentatus TaxID=1538716 RepID=A0AAV5VYN1_9BILA|nr:hypothetical protein PFISCL1PPCAC_15134 [Pristionchus fissidentatus]